MSLEGTVARRKQDEVFDDGKRNVFSKGLLMFVTSRTYVGGGNEVILNSKIKLVFGSVLMFSTVFIFYKFIMDITQQM